MAAKLSRAEFDLEDFLNQMQVIKKMGPLEHILGMIPGVGKQLKGMQIDDRAFVHVEAIINSMTVKERHKPEILNGSRRRRIARGSGTTVQEVNQLMRQFGEMKKMMKRMKKMKFRKGSLPGTFPF